MSVWPNRPELFWSWAVRVGSGKCYWFGCTLLPCDNNILRAKCQENQLKQALFGIFFFILCFKEICHLKICKNSESLSWSQKTYWKIFQWKILKIGCKGCMSSGRSSYGSAMEDQKVGLARFGNAKGRPCSILKVATCPTFAIWWFDSFYSINRSLHQIMLNVIIVTHVSRLIFAPNVNTGQFIHAILLKNLW